MAIFCKFGLKMTQNVAESTKNHFNKIVPKGKIKPASNFAEQKLNLHSNKLASETCFIKIAMSQNSKSLHWQKQSKLCQNISHLLEFDSTINPIILKVTDYILNLLKQF